MKKPEPVRTEIWNKVWSRVRDTTWSRVRDTTRSHVWFEVRNGDRICDTIKELLNDQT